MRGAGAVLWSEPDQDGRRECLAQLAVATPRLRNSMLGEAAGMAYGILLVASVVGSPGPMSILGDNLPVVRLGACNARMRADGVWREVEDALMLVAGRRWPTRWHAVRRHLNRDADALATLGVLAALRSIEAVSGPDEVWLWCDAEAFGRRGWHIPTVLTRRPDAVAHAAGRPCAI